MKKPYVYAFLAVLIAISLRLYPYLLTGLPFSVDAWAPIRNTELLLQDTPVNLGSDVFDGYNNYWPGISLFGAVVSEVTSLEPLHAMGIFIPLTGGLTILLFYALTRTLFNSKIAFIASIFFATAFTHTFFTAGVTKETLANPLYLLLILIFLHPTMPKPQRLLLFTATSIALTMTHHLTPLITIAILSAVAVSSLIANLKKGRPTNRFDFLLISILAIATTTYYTLYASTSTRILITYSDLFSAACYQIVTFALAIYVTSRPRAYSKTKTLVTTSGALAIALFLTVILMRRPIMPSVPAQPPHYLLYDLPYILLPPLVILGYGYHRQAKAGTHTPSIFWLAAIIGVGAYAIFSNSTVTFTLTYRTLNFLHPIVAIFAAMGLYRLSSMGNSTNPRRVLNGLIVVATILVIATTNAYSLYASVSLEERYMGYVWLYRQQEFEAGEWVATKTNLPVAGDLKSFHFFHSYLDLDVNVLEGYNYLTANSETPPKILYLYAQMEKNGYVLGYHGLDLPENWKERLLQLNQVYSNGFADFYSALTH